MSRPTPIPAQLITEKWGLEKDSYVLFLGRIVPEKGLRYLVEAWKDIKTDKKLVIAGGSSDTEAFMLHLVERYYRMEDHSDTVILMAYDALKEYLSFHSEEKNDVKIREIQDLMDKVYSVITLPEHEKHGGTYSIMSAYGADSFNEFQSLVNSRHNIRDFSGEIVPMEDLRQAMNVAFRCPTACNRQGVRAYILTGKNKDLLSDWVIGIGGFGDKVEKYILITGKLSEYREDEQFQYIVSASIFAGYLTLALEAKNIGCCVVQRPVLLCKKWRELQTQLNIPADEQIVLMLGVGMKKKDYKVPVSYRLPYDELVKEL